ncbi:cell wall protein DAN4-like [Rhagoletis pomonella]|uniref:cell wall protein DAN4-like n=1 Tax=Rhagoletis pomonella TaxID=28610 RepID=UPI0017837404|nr:cell wall protein DAN4-like [Rhagoletis pomonella]
MEPYDNYTTIIISTSQIHSTSTCADQQHQTPQQRANNAHSNSNRHSSGALTREANNTATTAVTARYSNNNALSNNNRHSSGCNNKAATALTVTTTATLAGHKKERDITTTATAAGTTSPHSYDKNNALQCHISSDSNECRPQWLPQQQPQQQPQPQPPGTTTTTTPQQRLQQRRHQKSGETTTTTTAATATGATPTTVTTSTTTAEPHTSLLQPSISLQPAQQQHQTPQQRANNAYSNSNRHSSGALTREANNTATTAVTARYSNNNALSNNNSHSSGCNNKGATALTALKTIYVKDDKFWPIS